MTKLVEVLKLFQGKVVTVTTPFEMFMGKLDFSPGIGWLVKYGSDDTERFQPLIAGFDIDARLSDDLRLRIRTTNLMEDE